jgi:hypothetical protein
MSHVRRIRLLLETATDQRFLEGLLGEQLKSEVIRVEQWNYLSTMIGVAQLSLLERPEWSIALVINTNSEDPIEIDEEYRGPVSRILAGTATRDYWYAAFAIPRLDAWAMVDPRIRQAFEQDERGHGPRSYHERSLRFAELVREEPFDSEALYRENAEFRGLVDFINRHAPAAQPVGG